MPGIQCWDRSQKFRVAFAVWIRKKLTGPVITSTMLRSFDTDQHKYPSKYHLLIQISLHLGIQFSFFSFHFYWPNNGICSCCLLTVHGIFTSLMNNGGTLAGSSIDMSPLKDCESIGGGTNGKVCRRQSPISQRSFAV